MRTPTSLTQSLAWWREALTFPELIDAIPQEPQPGFYKRQLVRGGVYVPVKIWLEGEIDSATGELASDEYLRCDMNGSDADPDEQWHYVAENRITEGEYNYLTALRQHAAWHEPDHPSANPRKPIDLRNMPPPDFDT